MKIGIIGSGAIADLCVDAFRQIPEFTLQNVYSRDLEKAQKKQKEWGFHEACHNMDDFLKSDIDIVYVATPNRLHSQQITECLQAKKHVICEKPLVLSEEEFTAVYQLADKNNLFLFEAFRHINSPNYQFLKEQLASIGKIRFVHFSFNQYSSKYDAYKRGENPNIFNPKLGGGALNDLGIYPISLALGLFGDYKSYSYKKTKLSNGVDGSGALILEYDDFLCQISFSKICQGQIENEIIGEEGAILLKAISALNHVQIKGKDYNFHEKQNDMFYEMTKFLSIMQNNDENEYGKLRDISHKSCKLIEELHKLK